MYVLGFYQQKFALLEQTPEGIRVLALREGKEGEDLGTGKGVTVVSGLEAKDVACRTFEIGLTKEKEILATLPFQAQSLLPFPPNEAVLLPFLTPLEGKTGVTLFATRQELLSSHVEKMQVSPDVVSSVPAALFRWSHWLFPDKEEIGVVYDSCCVVSSKDKILSSHFLAAEKEKLETFVKTKFSNAFLVPDQDGPSWDAYDFATLKKFAIPLGLALDYLKREDGKSHQFRQGPFISPKEKHTTARQKKLYLAFSLGMTCLFTALGWTTLALKEKKLRTELSLYEPSTASLSLEESIGRWEEKLKKSKKEAALSPPIYPVSDILAALSSRKERVEIRALRYTVEKKEPYLVKVELEFTAPSVEEVRAFKEALKKETTWIQTNQEILEESLQEGYRLSFYLKNT